jgi:hypothetical protein
MSGRRTLRLLRRLGSAASLLAAALPALAAKPEFGPNVLFLDPSMPSQAYRFLLNQKQEKEAEQITPQHSSPYRSMISQTSDPSGATPTWKTFGPL